MPCTSPAHCAEVLERHPHLFGRELAEQDQVAQMQDQHRGLATSQGL